MSKSVRAFLRSRPAVYKAHGVAKYGLFRASLLLNEWKDRRAPRAAGDLPVPPSKLRFRVGGSFDRDQFLEFGRHCAHDLERLARLGGKDLARCPAVLD